MAFPGFTDKDYDVFDIPRFEDRMAAIRQHIRPKLVELSVEVVDGLKSAYGLEFHPHVASHLRRRVNPPMHTWAAFGPEKRGYKSYPHLSVGIEAEGPYVEFIVMAESPNKAILSNGLKRNAEKLAPYLSQESMMSLHLNHANKDDFIPSEVISVHYLTYFAEEMMQLKSNECMIYHPYRRDEPSVQGAALIPTALKDLIFLEPIYRCALDDDYHFLLKE